MPQKRGSIFLSEGFIAIASFEFVLVFFLVLTFEMSILEKWSSLTPPIFQSPSPCEIDAKRMSIYAQSGKRDTIERFGLLFSTKKNTFFLQRRTTKSRFSFFARSLCSLTQFFLFCFLFFVSIVFIVIIIIFIDYYFISL